MPPARKPHPDAATLNAAMSAVDMGLPSATPAIPVAGKGATAQVNFKCSEAFADICAEAAAKEGSLRRLFARLLHQAGYPVPDGDLHPVETRRRRK
jgi:hypothetical protein